MMNTLVITEARGALALAGTGQGIVMVVAVLAVLAVIIAVLSRITNRATSQPQAATPAPQPAAAPAEAVPAPAPKPQGKPIPVTQSRGECDLVAVDDRDSRHDHGHCGRPDGRAAEHPAVPFHPANRLTWRMLENEICCYIERKEL